MRVKVTAAHASGSLTLLCCNGPIPVAGIICEEIAQRLPLITGVTWYHRTICAHRYLIGVKETMPALHAIKTQAHSLEIIELSWLVVSCGKLV